MAEVLCEVALLNGWEVRTGWSLVAVPAGYRESSRHKEVESAYLMEVFGVWLNAYRTRAWATWHLGDAVPKSERGSQGGFLLVPGRTIGLGVEALTNYVRGDVGIDALG